MKQRVTLSLEESIITNVHKEQSKRIMKTNKGVSFSELVEEALTKKYGGST